MSYLPIKGANKQSRKPLKYLSASEANRTMSTPSNHHQTRRVVPPTVSEEDHVREHQALYSTPRLPSTFEESGLVRREHVQHSPPRMFPDGINRPRLYTEFNGSNHYGYGPAMDYGPSHPGYYPQDEYGFYQESKRFKIDVERVSAMRHGSYPSFHPGLGRVPYHQSGNPPSEYGFHQANTSNNASVTNESRHDDEPRRAKSNEEQPHLLWFPEDKQHLTELHCFVRKHCVFIFSATHDDVSTPRKGRKKALNLGQIGIGCLHCRRESSESKLKGSTYFPTSISGIYNATMIIQQRHFPVCPSVPRETFCQYNKLKGLTARSASTKEYWETAAKKLGLVDTPKGVFFRSIDQLPASPQQMGTPQDKRNDNLARLVLPSDKMFATEYAYFVMEQMTMCVFTESDRLGKRKCHKVGFPGMACRWCYGGNGSGRFFPLTLKTFSDVSKSINVLRNHLVKCTKAPSWMANKVNALYKRHKDEKQTTPFGSQKIFFDHIWKRLHPELTLGDEGGDEGSPKKPAPAKRPLATAARKAIRQAQPDVRDTDSQDRARYQDAVSIFVPQARTPLPPLPSPPIIHMGKLSSKDAYEDEARPNKELCMIPKKRYLYSHGKSDLCHPSLPPLYPSPPSLYGTSLSSRYPSFPSQEGTSYSESDVSVAMILANGLGRNNDISASTKPESKEAV